MTKRHFIALADSIREANSPPPGFQKLFTTTQINWLADFCQSQNSKFNRDRWLAYIAGECGSGGGKVKGKVTA